MQTSRKPKAKVIAAGATALGGALIVWLANKLGIADIDPAVAEGMALAAVLAFGGGYQKTEA